MWPPTLFRLAAEAAGLPAWQVIAPGVLALLTAVGAALIAMRGTFRQASTTREVEFDKAVDRDREQLRAQVETLTARVDALLVRVESLVADRDRYREMYAQLRLDVRAEGIDPDKLGGSRG